MDEKNVGLRIAIYLILHGLLWAFAMILADSLWGDAIAHWMAVVFGVVNGLVALVVVTRLTSAARNTQPEE